MSYHIPILTQKIVDNLIINKSGTYIDCTIGFGGHSEKIVQNLNDDGILIGIDLDPYALKMAKKKLRGSNNKIIYYNSSYLNFPSIVDENNIDGIDGFLFDLGISSYQVDSKHRGFSYMHDGPLDMRFNPDTSALTAEDIINNYKEKELAEIMFKYGEERYSRRIAKAIVNKRKNNRIQTTSEFKNIIFSTIPFNDNKVLSRVFQAIRIAVNDEIDTIKKVLSKALRYLNVGGRIAVISFHSIEDRIVKHFFKENSIQSLKKIQKIEKHKFKILTKKPIVADRDEQRLNKRSKSAKLRIAERIS